ncbi:DNA binding domain protein [Mycobacterium phage Nebkiss]|nr:DNA binding domain protein [Mycobacterium phage Nebkiss]
MPSIANKFKVGDRIVCETASGWKYEGVVKSVDADSDTVTYTCTCVDPVWSSGNLPSDSLLTATMGGACCVELQEVSPRPGRTTVALGLRDF